MEFHHWSWLVVACLATAPATVILPAAQAAAPTKARAQQRERIIVQLRIALAKTEKERAVAIAAARKGLLRELATHSYRVVREFDVIPHIALEVSPAALAVVRESKWVAGVASDDLSKPLPKAK